MFALSAPDPMPDEGRCSPPASGLLSRAAGRLLVLWLALLVCACDGEPRSEGPDWKAPRDEAMQEGFAPQDGVPDYALLWRMPPGFRGFCERWNREAEDYLLKACESRFRQLALLAIEPVLHRRRLGAYLVFADSRDLPEDLVWEDGSDEPELGSPKARKGGVMRMAIRRSFPTTLRVFGPNSTNATRRYIYDDLDIPLVRLHPATGRIIPGTADRWAVSPDGRTVYFHLDPEARFSNGAPLTTRDFVHWQEAPQKLRMPSGAAHGAVLKVPASLVDTLLRYASQQDR